MVETKIFKIKDPREIIKIKMIIIIIIEGIIIRMVRIMDEVELGMVETKIFKIKDPDNIRVIMGIINKERDKRVCCKLKNKLTLHSLDKTFIFFCISSQIRIFCRFLLRDC